MSTQLAFHNTKFNVVAHNNQTWLSSKELAQALEYASAKSVTDIYNKNLDEFTDGMSLVVESTTNGVNASQRRLKVRVFSLRGAHLIAMFARTPVAKEFRRWVLDILDREVQHSPIAKQFTDEELINLCYVQLWMEKCQRLSKQIYPAMRDLGSDISGTLRDIACETRYMTDESKKALLREVQNLDSTSFMVQRAQPMLAKLRGEKWMH